MSDQHTTDGAVIRDMVSGWLEEWAGLAAYVARRRDGAPADRTMDTLLQELLYARLGRERDLRFLLGALLRPD